MPIYEYKCRECGWHFEKRQKISDEPLKICEQCGGELEKMWSRPGFQFKGEGWYVTDYARKSSAATDGEKSPGPESTAKSEKASNTKTEVTKPEAAPSKKE